MGARVSVIMPLYNKHAYVEETLRALVPQLHDGDEILVIDDCSTDGSRDVAQGVLANVEAARVITMARNAGPASARNAGARAAAGTHLLFFDADDLPLPSLLAELRHAVETEPADGIWTFGLAFQAHGETAGLETPAPGGFSPLTVLARDAFVLSVLAGKPLCTASSTCVRADVFAEAGGFQEGLRYCEDPELWARLSAKHRIVRIKRTLAVYRDVPASLSYGLRALPGSVDPYVRTLLSLAPSRGEAYRRLAVSMITRNAVFSMALGGDRRDLLDYLARVREVLPPSRTRALRWLARLPRFVVRAPLALRGALARHRQRTTNRSLGAQTRTTRP